jgi:hypothetical protein
MEKYAREHNFNIGASDANLLMEKGPSVGFAAARDDIDWVDENRKFHPAS